MLSPHARISSFSRIMLITAALAASACSYSIHQQYIGSIDPDADYNKGRWVTADAKDHVILSFQLKTTYVQDAVKELEAKCAGRISQVTTKHVTSFKFLSYEQKVILRGWCAS
jgi:hypothetical protein